MVTVQQHDINSGITKTLFQKDSHGYINDLQIINNTLFFSNGGYMIQGGTYALDLPPTELPTLITESRNAKITHQNNRYWLNSGEGDSCGSYRDYSLLDIKTKKVTEIANTAEGCTEGEGYIGIDRQERMILAGHTADYGVDQNDLEHGKYQYVIAIPLSNPQLKEGVISKETMPTGISSIQYIEEKDSLSLLGKSLYIFDLKDNVLTKIIDLPQNWYRSTITDTQENSICLTKIDVNGNAEISEVNLDTKQMILTSNICSLQPTPTITQQTPKQTLQDLINKLSETLQLPSHYKIELVESTSTLEPRD